MCDCVCVRWHEWVQASMYPSERLMGSAACVCVNVARVVVRTRARVCLRINTDYIQVVFPHVYPVNLSVRVYAVRYGETRHRTSPL